MKDVVREVLARRVEVVRPRACVRRIVRGRGERVRVDIL